MATSHQRRPGSEPYDCVPIQLRFAFKISQFQPCEKHSSQANLQRVHGFRTFLPPQKNPASKFATIWALSAISIRSNPPKVVNRHSKTTTCQPPVEVQWFGLNLVHLVEISFGGVFRIGPKYRKSGVSERQTRRKPHPFATANIIYQIKSPTGETGVFPSQTIIGQLSRILA